MSQSLVSAAPTERGQRSRTRILAAATELFAAHGYEGVTMRAIGNAAGLDNSSLYKHFSSKAELANAILDASSEALLSVVDPLESSGEPRLEQLVETAVAVTEYLSQYPATARLLIFFMTTPASSESGFNIHVGASDGGPSVELVGRWFRWLLRARKSGVIRRVNVIEAAVNLIALLVFRPATAGNFLSAIEGDPFEPAARRARAREVEAFVRAAFAPEAT